MPFKHILLAILVAAVWGCNFIFVKLGVQEIPPLFLCAIRFFLASFPAVFFIRMPRGAFKMVASYGIIMFALQFSLIFTGIAIGMTAGMTALIAQTAIFFSILFAAIFLQEMPTFWQVSGALLSFSGIMLAATHLDNHMTIAGFSLVIAGAAAWGLGNLLTRKLREVKITVLVGWGSLVAFPILLLLSFLLEGSARISHAIQYLSWIAVISLLYIVYMSTWVGYGVWSWLLARYPVSAVVPFTLLIPVFAMLGSTIFLDESFEPWKMTVAALVIAGLCVNLFVPRLLARKKV